MCVFLQRKLLRSLVPPTYLHSADNVPGTFWKLILYNGGTTVRFLRYVHAEGRRGFFSSAWALVCVCCVFSSHSFWTSSSLDVPAGVTQEEGHTGFLIHLLSAVRALIFLARRIQPFLSLVDREVEFCVLTI